MKRLLAIFIVWISAAAICNAAPETSISDAELIVHLQRAASNPKATVCVVRRFTEDDFEISPEAPGDFVGAMYHDFAPCVVVDCWSGDLNGVIGVRLAATEAAKHRPATESVPRKGSEWLVVLTRANVPRDPNRDKPRFFEIKKVSSCRWLWKLPEGVTPPVVMISEEQKKWVKGKYLEFRKAARKR